MSVLNLYRARTYSFNLYLSIPTLIQAGQVYVFNLYGFDNVINLGKSVTLRA